MSSNSIFIGITLISSINNQKRYEAVLNEILQYLSTHIQEISILIQPGKFLVLQSITSNSSDQVVLPLSPFFLHSCFFRIHSGFQLQQEDKKFGSIAWEVLNILKENFPSKIHLQQENLELCKPVYIEMSQAEELRRQISCLMSIKEEERILSHDEFEDVWYTLQFAEKVQDARSLNISLELITQYSPISCFSVMKQDQDLLKRIIEKNDFSQLNSNKILAQELLDKISQQQTQTLNETLQRQDFDDTISIASDTGIQMPQSYIERPTSTRMCLFQLTESNDINRVSLILDTLGQRSYQTIQQLRKKYQLNTKLISILKKYCNGDYGFDQRASRNGTFQLKLLNLLAILSQEYVVFLEYLQNQTLDYLSQLIEEGIIFAFEDAISGQSINSNLDLYKFLKIALSFIELVIGRQFKEFIPSIRENLRKIQLRMQKLLQKKENGLLNYFISQFSNQIISSQCEPLSSENQEQNGLEVDQLNDLKAISIGLYEFAIELNFRIQRVEALHDIQEEHEEKHSRLFYKLMSVNNKKQEQSGLPSNKESQQKRAVQFIDNLELESFRKKELESYEKDKNNNFVKNTKEYPYKRPLADKSNNEYPNKENQAHYIGSPIKPLQRGDHNYRKEQSFQ